MVLQSIQFSPIGNSHYEMYYRYYYINATERPLAISSVADLSLAINNVADLPPIISNATEQRFLLHPGCELNFNTYFNSFSNQKWREYTTLANVRLVLRLKGTVEVALTKLMLNIDGRVDEYVLGGEVATSDGEDEISIEYPAYHNDGIFAFKLRPLTEGEFLGGYYATNIDENAIPEVNIALCVCTYKREGYIARNMKMLRDNIFCNQNSMLRNHLYVYIADNGQTLDAKAITDKCGNWEGGTCIHVFPNLNSGGSGGFSRCIIEALADKERHNLTHVILMDDDVEFTHFTLERTYRLLQLLKTEYEDAAVGGAMFRLHSPNWQHAAGELCKGGLAQSIENGMWNPKPNLDMNRVGDVVRHELTETINYTAWWYFCVRLNDELRANLSMPFFFQWDDCEYQLRIQHTIITMNGICLRHEDFAKKASMSKDYYILRNKWISCAIHPETGYGKGQMKRQIIKFVARNIMEYRYRSADIWLRGAEDFFKGLKWLGAQNPQILNTEIMRYATQMSPVQQLPFDFAYNLLKTERDYKESKLKRLWRRVTLNGYLLPAKGEVTVPVIGINKSFVFRKKRVLNYDLDSQKGFITEKSYKEAWRVVMRLLRVLRTIDRDYEKTVNDYRAKHPQYVTEEFWRNYLGLDPKS